MIILVGASASGKTEIAKLIIKKYGFKKMVTTTTRPMRAGEVADIDYHFISKEEFTFRVDDIHRSRSFSVEIRSVEI